MSAAAPAGAFGRSVAALLVSQLCLLAAYGGFITTYGAFASERLGWSTLDIGLVFTVFALGDISLGAVLAHLADRTGRRRVAIISLAVIASWALLFVAELPRLVLYGFTLLVGAALTGFGASWFALLTEVSPPDRRGRIFGTVSAISQLGVILGALVSSTIWQQVGLAPALAASSAAAALGIVPLLALPRPAGAG